LALKQLRNLKQSTRTMGNCTGAEVDSPMVDHLANKEVRVVSRDFVFDEAGSPVRESGVSSEAETECTTGGTHRAESDEVAEAEAKPGCYAGIAALLGASPEALHPWLLVLRSSGEEHMEAEIPTADVVEDASGMGEPDCIRHQAIASLQLLRPEARWLSLLRVSGEHQAIASLQLLRPEARWLSLLRASGGETTAVEQNDKERSLAVGGLCLPSGALSPDSGVGAKTMRFKSQDVPAEWVPDASAKGCYCCNANFTFMRRRHHCRACGQVVCSSCSTGRKVIAALGHSKPARCCDGCMSEDQ